MRYKNNIGPQVRHRRYALGWSQSTLTTKFQIAGLDASRSGVSKIEARLRFVDDGRVKAHFNPLAPVLSEAKALLRPRSPHHPPNHTG
jgi:transcriptional regulator with XRE-family HTH domain